ncbi:Hypothetical protein, putative [Bodo saltans]|uniref:Uncharacterized protein n=1 Tax=Bodo saltans TaxID=75058 RepID=A0A0S4J1A9_BODSA|nr:Hypothetical protein, putative [Bodo saltans]|eukprot:CUG30670.1 Hypothetical protein, putative [Bodo saltans]
MSAEEIVNAWKGWWSVPQFDAPLRPASLSNELSSSSWQPLSWHVDVTREPVVVEDDPTTPTVNAKRSRPTRHRHISVQWSNGGERFVARGILSDSLLLAEEMSVYRRVAIDSDHPIIPAELNAWKGWWSVPQFDAPLRPASLSNELSSSSWQPLSWHVDVTREPVVVEDDPTTPTVNAKRSRPTRHRHISVQWSNGGERFVARGILSDSLLLAEGMSVYRRVAIDSDHPIIPAELIEGGFNVVGPARDVSHEKPLYVVPDPPKTEKTLRRSAASPSTAEQFISPMTLQLLHHGTQDVHIRVSLDWKRLFHGVGTSVVTAVPQAMRPSVLCIRVLQATGPTFDALTPPEVSNGTPHPSGGGTHSPRLPSSLFAHATRICVMMHRRTPDVFGYVPSVHISQEDNVEGSGTTFNIPFHSSYPIADNDGNAQLAASPETSTRISLQEYRSLMMQEQLAVHFGITSSSHSVGSSSKDPGGCKLPRCAAIGVTSLSVERCLRAKSNAPQVYVMPVDDMLLAQLQAHHFRCSLVDVQLGSPAAGTHSAKCDNIPIWSQSDATAPFVRCEGAYSSVNMAAMSIAKLSLATT